MDEKTSVVLIRMKTKGVIVMNEILIVRKQPSEAFFVVYCVCPDDICLLLYFFELRTYIDISKHKGHPVDMALQVFS